MDLRVIGGICVHTAFDILNGDQRADARRVKACTDTTRAGKTVYMCQRHHSSLRVDVCNASDITI